MDRIDGWDGKLAIFEGLVQVGSFRALRKVAQVVFRCVEMGRFSRQLRGPGCLGCYERFLRSTTLSAAVARATAKGNTRMDAEWRTQWVKDSGGWVRRVSASVG